MLYRTRMMCVYVYVSVGSDFDEAIKHENDDADDDNEMDVTDDNNEDTDDDYQYTAKDRRVEYATRSTGHPLLPFNSSKDPLSYGLFYELGTNDNRGEGIRSLAVSPGSRNPESGDIQEYLWIANEDAGEVLILDTSTGKYVTHVHLHSPIGLYYDESRHIMWVTSKGYRKKGAYGKHADGFEEISGGRKNRLKYSQSKEEIREGGKVYGIDAAYVLTGEAKDVTNSQDVPGTSSQDRTLRDKSHPRDPPFEYVRDKLVVYTYTHPQMVHPTGVRTHESFLYVGEQIHNRIFTYHLEGEREFVSHFTAMPFAPNSNDHQSHHKRPKILTGLEQLELSDC